MSLVLICLLAGCGPSGSETGNFRGAMAFGESGRQPAQFSRPRAVTFTKSGLIAVIDRTGRLQLFRKENWEFVRQWRFPQYGNGTPTGITTDPTDDTLWVADTHYSRIIHYDQEGRIIKMFGKAGENPGQMIFPTDAVADPDGKTLWVCEYGRRNRIIKMDREGVFEKEWGSEVFDSGDLGRPMAICLSDDAQRLYVIDAGNNRVVVYDRDGKELKRFGRDGNGPGEMIYPLDMAMAPDGSLYVMEYGNCRVSRFTQDGKFLGAWGEPGYSLGQLYSPWGCAVSQEGDLLMADTNNNRLQLLKDPTKYFHRDIAPGTYRAPVLENPLK
ncbi:SMP-30/gluconolactonase/LRE family protein [Candidatus Sumerlaeota bacterium]|nr:SMP-30/gluconolactonase/LRE family protein [Candidatus Sumerlaeota bacterium]